MDNEKRRSSILKSQPPAAVLGNGINADEATSIVAMARRRVSFSTVRTVKKFDHDQNAVTSPHDEPLKLGGTGGSGSLSSAQISQAVDVAMDTTQIVGEFGWQHNTDFLPKAASTPMPRSGLHAPQEADGESKLSMSTDFSTTANVFGQAECSEMLVCDELGEASMDISGATLTFTDLKKTIAAELTNTNANETTSMNNTRALLAKSPPVSHGRLNHTFMGNAPQQPATPTFCNSETMSVCTPEQVSQKLAMTRRRLRRSLDNHPLPLNIVVPEIALHSLSLDFEANSPQAAAAEGVRHDIDCTRETTRQSNGEVLEEAGETTVMRNQLICSCISNYASLDFDSGITTMACFKSLHSYSDAVKKIKQAALTGTKRLIEQCVERMSEDIAYRLEDSTTQDNIFTLAGFQNLDQRMMSRRESHVFEVARLDAQKEWFLVRNEVIAGALRKAEEIIAREMQCYNERMRMLETVKEYQNSKSDEAWIDKQLAELEHFKSTVTEMGNGKDSEALKSELRAAKRAKKRQYLDNMRLDTERLKIELEVSRREAEKSESLTQMLNEREQARKLKRKQLAERADELLRRSH